MSPQFYIFCLIVQHKHYVSVHDLEQKQFFAQRALFHTQEYVQERYGKASIVERERGCHSNESYLASGFYSQYHQYWCSRRRDKAQYRLCRSIYLIMRCKYVQKNTCAHKNSKDTSLSIYDALISILSTKPGIRTSHL